ncbi:MAG: hypothetical protein R3C18_08650 [Planctomycetaceae bacterium]
MAQELGVPAPSFPPPAPQPSTLPAPAAVQAQALAGPQADDEIILPLEQGPIHEAFAELITLDARSGVVAPKAPPEPINEVPPDLRPEGTRVEWFPGYWAWAEDLEDFIWISGVWRDVPPGQQFIPGYWSETPDGFVWTSGFWTSEAEEELAYLPEPPTTLDLGPTYPQPGTDYFWVPGNWVYRSNTYVWQTGFWNRGYNNWVWVPNRYRWTPRGWIFARGYWDYPLVSRGLLFAPIRYRTPIYARIGYRYTPYRWLNTAALLSRLFIAPHRGHYFYGNYGGSRYLALGYRPWINVSQIRGGYDPFYAYHSWNERSRGNSNWINNYRNDFTNLANLARNDRHFDHGFNGANRALSGSSRDFIRDLRDFQSSGHSVRIPNFDGQHDRITAFSTLRNERSRVESIGRPDFNSSRLTQNLPGSRDGNGPGSNGSRNGNGLQDRARDVTEGLRDRGSFNPREGLRDLASNAANNRPESFRIPESVRNTLARTSLSTPSANAGPRGNNATGPSANRQGPPASGVERNIPGVAGNGNQPGGPNLSARVEGRGTVDSNTGSTPRIRPETPRTGAPGATSNAGPSVGNNRGSSESRSRENGSFSPRQLGSSSAIGPTTNVPNITRGPTGQPGTASPRAQLENRSGDRGPVTSSSSRVPTQVPSTSPRSGEPNITRFPSGQSSSFRSQVEGNASSRNLGAPSSVRTPTQQPTQVPQVRVPTSQPTTPPANLRSNSGSSFRTPSTSPTSPPSVRTPTSRPTQIPSTSTRGATPTITQPPAVRTTTPNLGSSSSRSFSGSSRSTPSPQAIQPRSSSSSSRSTPSFQSGSSSSRSTPSFQPRSSGGSSPPSGGSSFRSSGSSSSSRSFSGGSSRSFGGGSRSSGGGGGGGGRSGGGGRGR